MKSNWAEPKAFAFFPGASNHPYSGFTYSTLLEKSRQKGHDTKIALHDFFQFGM